MRKTFYNDTFQVKFSLTITDEPRPYFNGRGTTYNEAGDEVIHIIISPKESAGSLAHEIAHAIDFMYDAMGIERSTPTDEPYAYMVGWLTNKMLPVFQKNQIFKNKK